MLKFIESKLLHYIEVILKILPSTMHIPKGRNIPEDVCSSMLARASFQHCNKTGIDKFKNAFRLDGLVM